MRGPTSALSSFLRERNIRVENRSRRVRREQETQQTEASTSSAVAAASTEGSEPMEGVEQTEVTTTTAAQSASTTTIIYTPRGGLRRSTRSATTQETAEASSSKTKAKAKKRKHESDSDDDFDDDADFAPSSSRKVVVGRARIVFCTECKGRFARTLDNEDQTICNDCINGVTVTKKPVARKRQIAVMKKDTLVKDNLPSLQDICIAVVVDYIEDVDTLGVISEESSDKIAKIISRNRKLNDATSRLFMEPYKKRIDLYDCTGMTEVSLLNISQFCPRVEHINLVYSGRITDKVVLAYANNLHFLKSFHVSGAFLVTKDTWNEFFKKVGQRLESFSLRYSARLVKENIECLVKYCPNIKELKFGHLSAMDSDWLAPISTLSKLESFEFAWSHTDKPLKTEDVVDFLSKVGPNLTELSLKGGHELDDKVLTEGILKHCRKLKKLSLEQCDQLSAQAMVELFTNWKNPGLTHIDIGRCLLFDDEVLKAIIHHSGTTMKYLSIHSLDKLSSTGLEALGGDLVTAEGKKETFKACDELTHLNCGFVRAMDDFALKKVINNCASLEHISVWGCHMLTNQLKETNKLKIIGRESSALRA